jgi:hypothetical protein
MAAGGSEPGAIDDLNQSFEGLEEEEEREGDIGEILSEGGRRRVFSKVNVLHLRCCNFGSVGFRNHPIWWICLRKYNFGADSGSTF